MQNVSFIIIYDNRDNRSVRSLLLINAIGNPLEQPLTPLIDFDQMLEYISADVYYPQEISEEDWANRYTKNKANKAPKQAIKQATKKAKKARVRSSSPGFYAVFFAD